MTLTKPLVLPQINSSPDHILPPPSPFRSTVTLTIGRRGQDTQWRSMRRSGGTTAAQEGAGERGATTTTTIASTNTNTDTTAGTTVKSGASVVHPWSGPVKGGKEGRWRRGGAGRGWNLRGRGEHQGRPRGGRGRRIRGAETRAGVRQGG